MANRVTMAFLALTLSAPPALAGSPETSRQGRELAVQALTGADPSTLSPNEHSTLFTAPAASEGNQCIPGSRVVASSYNGERVFSEMEEASVEARSAGIEHIVGVSCGENINGYGQWLVRQGSLEGVIAQETVERGTAQVDQATCVKSGIPVEAMCMIAKAQVTALKPGR